jgi:hypothetical protein
LCVCVCAFTTTIKPNVAGRKAGRATGRRRTEAEAGRVGAHPAEETRQALRVRREGVGCTWVRDIDKDGLCVREGQRDRERGSEERCGVGGARAIHEWILQI